MLECRLQQWNINLPPSNVEPQQNIMAILEVLTRHAMTTRKWRRKWNIVSARSIFITFVTLSFDVLRCDAKWTAFQHPFASSPAAWGVVQPFRGGSTNMIDDVRSEEDEDEDEVGTADAYTMLAKAIQSRFRANDESDIEPDVETIVKAFRLMSSSHKAFKGLDGAAHEAYQRTRSTDEVDLTVSGRAKRSASRTVAVALGLGACELCELMTYPERIDFTSYNGTLEGREVLLNMTDVATLGKSSVNVLVLYEPSYKGGAGIRYGSIDDISTEEQERKREGVTGRFFVVIGDGLHQDLNQMLKILEQRPRSVPFGRKEAAAVQSSLYKAAGSVVKAISPILQSHNTSAIHFAGRAMSGGIATLAAIILDGALPMPEQSMREKQGDNENNLNMPDDNHNEIDVTTIQGLGSGRVSAMVLGTPPCLSPNVDIPFVKSILYGDDIIGRASPDSLDRFYKRTRRAMQQKNVIGKKLNWMSDAASMATSNIQAQVFSGKDKDKKLIVPGMAYLIRPRRLGNQCSIHEIGSQLRNGRESLRAAILWQLNDVLLSRSIWKHHQLDTYIHGIDRVHLRGLDDSDHEV